MHLAAYLGLADMVAKLLNDGIEADSQDWCGETPLMWAVRRQNVAVAIQLGLQGDINPNILSRLLCITPVEEAVRNGLNAIVELFLGRHDVDVNGRIGRPLLTQATERGREGAVRLLLSHRGIDPGAKDYAGNTALAMAARSGPLPVVKLLLARHDVMADPKDRHGDPPLGLAAEYGHVEIVRQLLMRTDVDADSCTTKYRTTPLARAVAWEHTGVLKLLLARTDVDVNSRDVNGATPIIRAARIGYLDGIKLLFERNDVDVTLADTPGEFSPLQAEEDKRYGRTEAMFIDEKLGGTDFERGINFRQSPLHHAAEKGHVAMVELLLTHPEINAGDLDGLGQSAMSKAAQSGQCAVMQLLLSHDDSSLNLKNHKGQTALWVAARLGGNWIVEIKGDAVAELLLSYRDIDINCVDTTYERTPLLTTIDCCYSLVVNWFHTKNREYRTRRNDRHLRIAQMLLARDDIDVERPDTNGETLLSKAMALADTDGIGAGWIPIVEMIRTRIRKRQTAVVAGVQNMAIASE